MTARALLLLLLVLAFGVTTCAAANEQDTSGAGQFRDGGASIMARHQKIHGNDSAPAAPPLFAGDTFINTATGVQYTARRNALGVLFWLAESVNGVVRGYVEAPAAGTLSGGGQVFTANANGSFQTGNPGGVTTWAVGDRVALGVGAGATAVGVYVVTNLGSGSTPFVLTRADDAADAANLYNGRTFKVTEGDAAGTVLVFSPVAVPYVVGTSALGWQVMQVSPVGADSVTSDTIPGGTAGVAVTMRFAIAAGGGGAADDVDVFGGAGAPFRFQPTAAAFIVSTNVVGSSVQVRDTAGGAGAALSGPIATAAAGKNNEGTGGAFTAVGNINAGSPCFLRRSDSGVAGTLLLTVMKVG